MIKRTILHFALTLLIVSGLNNVYAQDNLKQSTLKEGMKIAQFIENNTEPEIITTSWQEPDDEKILVLGKIPGIKRFTSCYREMSCWMAPAMGLQLSELPIETQYFLGDLGEGRYVMLIPLVDDHFRGSLQGTKNNELVVVIESGDAQIKTTQSSSLYLSTGTDPYKMINEASAQLADYLKTFRLRKDKDTPWYVDNLGWHSWNAFYHHVSQDSTIKALKNFEKRKLPIKWIMIDDGVQGQKDRLLISYDADKVKFPNGLKEMTDIAKKQYGIEKVFAWSLPWGYWWGIDTTVFSDYRRVDFVPPARYANAYKNINKGNKDDILKESTIGPMFYPLSFVNKSFNIPGPTFGKFFYDYFRYLREQGIDGMKLDAMTWVETLGSNGKGGRIKWMREQLDGLQTAGDVQFNGEIINCSSMSNDYFFNSLTSNVTRSSMDFYPDIPATHGRHIYINAHTSFWIGNIVMPDWDMFQTGHYTGAFHGAARAISGGPIYISDEVGKENTETINAMATSRGDLLRSLTHGQVCRDNLFTDIKKEKKAIKIFNTNICNSIVGTFNCSYDNENPIKVSSEVKAADVEGVEGSSFAVYNFKTGKLTEAGATETFNENLDPLDFNLYTVSAITDGFAPIGLSGKYNPGAAITDFNRIDKNEWVIELMDGGEFVCYAEVKPEEVTLNGEPIDYSYERKTLKVTLPLQEGIVVKVGFSIACTQVEKKPNFLVILTDDQRMDALGCYNADCPIKTPNLDKLANEGIRFTNGFVTTPICVVSRACILTGRYATNNRVHHFVTEMEDDVFYDSYPVHLRKAGYFTGTLGKYGIGVTEKQKKAFDVFEGQAHQGPAFRNYKGRRMHDAEWLSVKTGEFLDQVPEGEAFCLQLNYKEPHESSEVAPEDDDLLENYFFGRNPMDTPEAYGNLPEHVKNGFGRRCYDAFYMKNGVWDPNVYMRYYHEKVISVDRSVGKIFKMLEEKGIADNTVIIFLSDHGTHHGEKQLGGKWTPYDASLRIPFMIYDPRKSAQKGIISDELVLNIDIATTLLDMAGIEIPETMDGKSLKPIINDEKVSLRDHFFFEHYTSPAPMPYIPRNVGLRTKTSKYVRWTYFDPAIEEYFDLARDSMESENLIDNPDYQNQVVEARKTFEQWRKDNPSTYSYNVYGKRPQYGAKEIDWEKFKQVRPKEYEKIKAEIDKLGVTWEQAMDDWDIRYKICIKAKYWY